MDHGYWELSLAIWLGAIKKRSGYLGRCYWGFFQGNSAKKDIVVNIDYHRPDVNILSNSYSITQGGSALVVFQVKDENLKDFYVKEGNKRYRVTPYKEEGYYASLIAWPFNQDHFSAKVVAEDFAGNKRVVNIPYYIGQTKGAEQILIGIGFGESPDLRPDMWVLLENLGQRCDVGPMVRPRLENGARAKLGCGI